MERPPERKKMRPPPTDPSWARPEDCCETCSAAVASKTLTLRLSTPSGVVLWETRRRLCYRCVAVGRFFFEPSRAYDLDRWLEWELQPFVLSPITVADKTSPPKEGGT